MGADDTRAVYAAVVDTQQVAEPTAADRAWGRWSRISAWTGAASLTAGLLGLVMVIFLSGRPETPEFVGLAFSILLLAAAPIGLLGAVFAVVALVRREGVRALVGLGMSLAGVVFVGILPAIAIAYFATFM